MLSLSAVALILGGCSFGENPLSERDTVQNTLPLAIEAERGECTHYGTVRKVQGQLTCDFLIILDEGGLVTPINAEELEFELTHKQRIFFGFTEQQVGNRGCLDAPYVSINCARRLESLDEAEDRNELRTN